MQLHNSISNVWDRQTVCRHFEALISAIRSAPPRIAIALTHRNFRFLWIGAFTSSIGTWMQKVAQAWLIITMTRSRSAFFLGLDSFLGELPLLLLTTLGGVLADRRDRRQMILMSQSIQMLVALILAALIYMKRIDIAHVLALSLVAGCARAFGGPAYQSLIPTLVTRKELPNAIALNSIQFNLAQLIGPLVAGAALASFGLVGCFGFNGISFLFVIAAILMLRNVHVPPMATESMTTQFCSGLRFIQTSSNLSRVIAIGFLISFFGAPLFTFLPVITRDVFHRDVGFYTHMMMASGTGAVIGALIVGWLGNNKHMGHLLLILLPLFGTIIVAFGLSQRAYLSALVLFTGGLLFVMCCSLTNSLAQLLAPPKFQGRVVSVYLVAFLGGSPLGGLTSGWLANRIGSAPAMLVVNGTVLTLATLHFLIHGEALRDHLATLLEVKSDAESAAPVISESIGIAPQLSLPPLRSPAVNISHGWQIPVQISWKSGGRARQKGEGTPMYLIALATERLAIWDGAGRDKTSHGLVCGRGGRA